VRLLQLRELFGDKDK